jgi:hypothetical protein
MRFEKVIDGIARYVDAEMYSSMNDWQEIMARMAVGRILGNKDLLKQKIMENPLLMSFVMLDAEGEMDVDKFLSDLKSVIAQKGGLRMSIPLFGNLKFVETDVDHLRKYIMNDW